MAYSYYVVLPGRGHEPGIYDDIELARQQTHGVGPDAKGFRSLAEAEVYWSIYAKGKAPRYFVHPSRAAGPPWSRRHPGPAPPVDVPVPGLVVTPSPTPGRTSASPGSSPHWFILGGPGLVLNRDLTRQQFIDLLRLGLDAWPDDDDTP